MNRIKSSKSSNNDDLNDFNEQEIAIQMQPKREKVKKMERMNFDAHILEDFDMTATKKDELISAKFSDTFKQVLEGFPISNKTNLKEQVKLNDILDFEPSMVNDERSHDDLSNRKVSSWNQRIDNSTFKAKLKIISAYNRLEAKPDLPIKSSIKKPSQQQQDVKSIRPKTALSFSNSSLISSEKFKANNRPTSTKSEIVTSSHRLHVSSLLFDGYEKHRQKDENNNNNRFDEEESDFNYISPSFRIKKYNLNDQIELELAKKDLLKRYSGVFKEPPSSAKSRPRTSRLNRFNSATKMNFSNNAIRTF